MPPVRSDILLTGILLCGLLAGSCATGSVEDSGGARRARDAAKDPPGDPSLSAGGSPVHFVEESLERGIDFVQVNGGSDEKYFVEVLGSGAIFFDADQDGDPDLYLPNQTTIAAPPPADPPHSALFINDGRGRFVDATEGSGLLDTGYALGVCGADIDNDGDTDLYVTRFDGANGLYRNEGGLKFTDIAAEAGVTGDPATDASCAFADVDGDGLVDLYVAGYVNHSRAHNIVCHRRLRATREKVREYCTPRHYSPVRDILYRNLGNGRFEDVSAASGVDSARGRSLGVAIADADNDGDADIYAACDRTASLYFENDGKGRFREKAALAGIALSEDGIEEAGMGTAWGDFDNDGWLDLVKTNYEKEVNNLYRNLEGRQFVELAGASGTGEWSFPYLAWGVDFFDADNDGDLDLFVANGHLRANLELYLRGKDTGLAGYEQFNLLYVQQGGRFVPLGAAAGPALTIRRVSRGTAWADIDADGDLDYLVTNLHDRPELHVNRSEGTGNWLKVRCVGTESNRSGIGARLTLEPEGRPGILIREIRSGQSYLSQSELTAHFGLGTSASARTLTIRWPSGRIDTHRDVPAGRLVVATEGAGLEPGA